MLNPKPLGAKWDDDLGRITRRIVGSDELTLRGADLVLSTPVWLRIRGGRSWLVAMDGRASHEWLRIDPALAKALRSARELASEHGVRPLIGGLPLQ